MNKREAAAIRRAMDLIPDMAAPEAYLLLLDIIVPPKRKRIPSVRKGKPRKGPMRDPAFLRWLRTQACFICADMIERRVFVAGKPWSQETATEAAHVGDRGLGQKCSDHEAVPMCAWHHRLGGDSHHKIGKKFWEHHGFFDKEAVSDTYYTQFLKEQSNGAH